MERKLIINCSRCSICKSVTTRVEGLIFWKKAIFPPAVGQRRGDIQLANNKYFETSCLATGSTSKLHELGIKLFLSNIGDGFFSLKSSSENSIK